MNQVTIQFESGLSAAQIHGFLGEMLGGQVIVVPVVGVKAFLWGQPSTNNAAALAAMGFGSVMTSGQWLPGYGGHPLSSWLIADPAAAAAGLAQYASFYLSNYNNTDTPMVNWFTGDWTTYCLTITALCAMAKAAGYAGIAIDTEMYEGVGGNTASWQWDYNGNQNSQAATENEAQARGVQFMQAVQAGFAGCEVVIYLSGESSLPGLYLDTLDAWLQTHGSPTTTIASEGLVTIDFMRGLCSAAGTSKVTFLDATFYKAGNVLGGPYGGDPDQGWARALAVNSTGFAALKLGLKAGISPFIWLDTDPAEQPYADLTTPAAWKTFQPHVLAAAQNGMFGIYQFADAFDYTPYAPVS